MKPQKHYARNIINNRTFIRDSLKSFIHDHKVERKSTMKKKLRLFENNKTCKTEN